MRVCARISDQCCACKGQMYLHECTCTGSELIVEFVGLLMANFKIGCVIVEFVSPIRSVDR
jgi:hypothetical protein